MAAAPSAISHIVPINFSKRLRFRSGADGIEIKDILQLLNAKANSIYEHTAKALSDKYTFSFNELYQSSSTNTALLDVEFDFGGPAANLTALQQLFVSVMGGDFRKVLTTPEPGVRLNRALLTHELRRHHHVEVRLPFYHSTFDEINKSLASADSVGSDHGRVLVYQLEASDDYIDPNLRHKMVLR